MAKEKKMSLEEVAAKVEWEGLGYAVQHYMTGDSIADPHLAELWDQAKELLDEIDGILEGVEPNDEDQENEDSDEDN
jgi:uncharacterized protein YgfB (UPF0149 family)